VERGDWLYVGGIVGIVDAVSGNLDTITLKRLGPAPL
jgi:hypothetical protein